MSPANGIDLSSVVPQELPPAVEPLAEFVNTTLSIVGRLGLGPQPSARLSSATSVLFNRRRATTQSADPAPTIGEPKPLASTLRRSASRGVSIAVEVSLKSPARLALSSTVSAAVGQL